MVFVGVLHQSQTGAHQVLVIFEDIARIGEVFGALGLFIYAFGEGNFLSGAILMEAVNVLPWIGALLSGGFYLIQFPLGTQTQVNPLEQIRLIDVFPSLDHLLIVLLGS